MAKKKEEVIPQENVNVVPEEGQLGQDGTSGTPVVEVTGKDEVEPVSDKVKVDARLIMKANNVKEVWRCPKKGYWFTRKDYADAHARKMEVVMRHFVWED